MECQKIENKELCKQCGGICCKGGGCAYISDDFKNLNMSSLLEALESGNISVAAHLDFKFNSSGKPYASHILYLRARNINREIIDLVSILSQCRMLKEDGCFYDIENRPTGGSCLVPNYPNVCETIINKKDIINTWLPYQNTLRKIVKRLTGQSVEERIRKDVEELAYRLYSNTINEYDSLISRDYYSYLLFDFSLAFPEEVEKGKAKALTPPPFIRTLKPNKLPRNID